MPPTAPPSQPSSRPSSVIVDLNDDDTTMTTITRPASLALMPPASAASHPGTPPSLRDILTNIAPPPYTLGAFTAFLSQNYCMETLEFTMDADRYRSAYADHLGEQAAEHADANKEHVCSLWRKIMNAYIMPYAPREVNLPSHVRNRLLSLPCSSFPPSPTELDEAVRIVYELMNDSVLGPFLQSVAAQQQQKQHEEIPEDAHEQPPPPRSRHRNRDFLPQSEDSFWSPRGAFLPMLSIPWSHGSRSSASSTSSDAGDRGLANDCGNTPSPGNNEPMTPPTTPPIGHWGFHTSPSGGGSHKAPSSHTNGWKRMSAKLGFSRVGRSRRGNSATSVPVDVMPIPEDAVPPSSSSSSSSSSESRLPADPESSTRTAERGREERRPCPPAGWEDPHPGERYTIAVLDNGAPLGAANLQNGVGRAGMAAKPYSTTPAAHGHRWSVGARRFAPARLRLRSDKPRSSGSTARPRKPEPVPAATHAKDDPMELTLTDFSNFLETGLTTITTNSTDASSFMSIDTTDRKQPASSVSLVPDDDPDPYGWEAAGRILGVGEFVPVGDFRRANGSKKTLLQRVLSRGNVRDH
ncbi:hypothetical protein VTJ83DRAFT_6684 [Remersonia thermophila]|uniref:RGS domain-containing protein n=1 Tax=Remersonia thermophila TaxID=72144 RepID=A0ABR4D5F1_9PEZI